MTISPLNSLAYLVLPFELCPHLPEIRVGTGGRHNVVHDVNMNVVQNNTIAIPWAAWYIIHCQAEIRNTISYQEYQGQIPVLFLVNHYKSDKYELTLRKANNSNQPARVNHFWHSKSNKNQRKRDTAFTTKWNRSQAFRNKRTRDHRAWEYPCAFLSRL